MTISESIATILLLSQGDYTMILILGISLFAGIAIILSAKKKPQENNKETDDSLSVIPNDTEKTMYDFFLEKYNQAEQEILVKAERETTQAQQFLDNTTDKTKKLFLESFIEHYKQDAIMHLINFSSYQEKDASAELDSLFSQAAEKVVAAQQFSIRKWWDWFGYDFDLNRMQRIIGQLCECGIMEQELGNGNYKIRVSGMAQLHRVIRQTNGRSLLTREDKDRLNEYFEKRRQELIGTSRLYTVLPCDEKDRQAYEHVIQAYEALRTCRFKWEVLASHANTETKAYASTMIDRREIHGMYRKSFNFVILDNGDDVPHFKLGQAGLDFYIYPQFVIAARSTTDFDVIDIHDFNMGFQKINFVETSNHIQKSQDAKFVGHTYKHVNKNGEKDARYSHNPRYSVYEYANLTFYPYDVTLQFSHSEHAENLYRKIQVLVSGGKEYTDSYFGATENYFQTANKVATQMNDFYDIVSKDRQILRTIDRAITSQMGDARTKLRNIFLADLIKCHEQLGHDATHLFTTEGLPLAIVEAHTLSNARIDHDTIGQIEFYNIIEGFHDMNKNIRDVFLKDKAEDFFYLNEVFKHCKMHEMTIRYFSLLYRLFSVVAKSDDHVTLEESNYLRKLMVFSHRPDYHKQNTFEKTTDNDAMQTEDKQNSPKGKEENPMENLHKLIGLTEVKKEVTALTNFVKIQQEREKQGLKAVGISYHCIFTGNPGTGKTTVARILAAIYRELGILKKGHLIETDRSGLVAEYVGQTAVKTNKIIDSAMDGVLFIDEAYSLVQGGSNDYGQEAIATLLKRMEDERNRFIAILAGYSEEMEQFVESNPGLQSRFSRHIHFTDYSVKELTQIFQLNAETNQYMLNDEAQLQLTTILGAAVEHKDRKFGNGRYARNLFEKAIQNQAMRLSSQPHITIEDLSLLQKEDLPANE